MEEEWIACREFPGHYEVSSQGRVRRKAASTGARVGRIRKGVTHKNGYTQYMLSVGNRPFMRDGHRLVADAFLGPIPEGHHVNHLNGVKGDNRLANLEIVTNSENRQHAYRVLKIPPNRGAVGLKNQNAKFGWDTVCAIREAYTPGCSTTKLARRFGVSRQTIYRIGSGKLRTTA